MRAHISTSAQDGIDCIMMDKGVGGANLDADATSNLIVRVVQDMIGDQGYQQYFTTARSDKQVLGGAATES